MKRVVVFVSLLVAISLVLTGCGASKAVNHLEAIKQAAHIIRSGGLVAFPTETVYGLGADAGNPQAVARLFEVKARPRIDHRGREVILPRVQRQRGD